MTEMDDDIQPWIEEEIYRIVLKGLCDPLDQIEAARLDALLASSPEYAMRVDRLVKAWMKAGILDPERIGRDNEVDLA